MKTEKKKQIPRKESRNKKKKNTAKILKKKKKKKKKKSKVQISKKDLKESWDVKNINETFVKVLQLRIKLLKEFLGHLLLAYKPVYQVNRKFDIMSDTRKRNTRGRVRRYHRASRRVKR